MSEEYSVGYSEGYQTGRNEAIDELEQEHRLLRARNDRLEAEANTAQPAPVQEHVATLIEHYAFTDGIVRFDGVENMEQLPVGTKFYTAAQPAPVPLTDEQKQHIHNLTGAGHGLISLVESYINEATHGITEKGQP
jgi:hypothetical protein